MTDAKTMLELADRIETNPLGWLPVVGDVINVTFEPREAKLVCAALRANGVAAEPSVQDVLQGSDPAIWADNIERTCVTYEVHRADSYRAAVRKARIDCLYDFEVKRLLAVLRALATPQPATAQADASGNRPVSDERALALARDIHDGQYTTEQTACEIMMYATDAIAQEKAFDAAQPQAVKEPCPYAEEGMECLLETHSFGPCLCANPSSLSRPHREGID